MIPPTFIKSVTNSVAEIVTASSLSQADIDRQVKSFNLARKPLAI